ncbi:hypothetical protein IKG28_02820 [Candidatus Saccharibacteria bacterium]|nr:hypothetical protein [Candidatus Saccharibacteria bacterium]
MSKRVTGSAVDPKNTATKTAKAKFVEESRKKDEKINKLQTALDGAKKGHEKQLSDNKTLKAEKAKLEAEVTKLKAELAKAQKAEADSKKAEAQAQADSKKVQLENADLKNKLDAANKRAEEAEKKANEVKAGGASELDIANGTVGEHTEYGFAIEIPGKGRQVIKPDDAKIEAIVTSYGEGVGKKSWWWVKEDGTVDDTQGDNGVPTIGQLLNLKKL